MTQLTHLVGLVLALAAAVLAIADQMVAITAINPTLAHWWPVVLAAATSIDRVGRLIQKPGKIEGDAARNARGEV